MRRTLFAVLSSVALCLACSDENSGIDLQAMNTEIDPCTDFYAYACGGWIASHPLHSDSSHVARFNEALNAALPDFQSSVRGASPEVDLYVEACLQATHSLAAREKVRGYAQTFEAIGTID